MEKTERRVLSDLATRNREKAAELSFKKLTRDLAAREADLPGAPDPITPKEEA